MLRNLLVILFLCGAGPAWAFPDPPTDTRLDNPPDVVCEQLPCAQCWETKRQQIEEYRLDCEGYRESCEEFKKVVELERVELEYQRDNAEISKEKYSMQLSEYRRTINIKYVMCLEHYKSKLNGYLMRIDRCHAETVICSQRPVKIK